VEMQSDFNLVVLIAGIIQSLTNLKTELTVVVIHRYKNSQTYTNPRSFGPA
jgi:hypothetical protein